ncbi:unnamed protein product [Closterium sp. Naga37s-1]|nr:unnamed protein product [Closterium sp. Naga37s-1]
MRASGHSLTSLRLGPTPTDASHWEDPYGHAQQQQQRQHEEQQQQQQQQQQHEEQNGHAEQQRHAEEQHERISPVFFQHCPRLQQLHLERANWHLSSLHPSWLKALRALTIHHSHCTASDFEFLAQITPQLHELSLYVLNQGQSPCTLDLSFSAAQSIHLVLDQHRVHLALSLPASLNSLSVSAHSLDLDCRCETPLSLDFLMLIGRKRLVVASLPLASAKDVYLNATSMQEESFNPLTNPPHSLSNPFHSPRISPNQPSISRELYSPSISESSLIRVLQSVAPTVEALMVPHSLPIEAVEGEWRELHRLAIGVRGSKAGGGRCRTTVEAAEARAGGISRLYTRRGGMGEGGDRGTLRSLLFVTRRCNSDTLVSLQEDFSSLEIYCVVGRLFCWKPIGSERLSQPVVCVSAHRTASNAPRFETTEGSSGEIDVGDFLDGLQCL